MSLLVTERRTLLDSVNDVVEAANYWRRTAAPEIASNNSKEDPQPHVCVTEVDMHWTFYIHLSTVCNDSRTWLGRIK
jgi:hypothetical protein